VKNATPEHVVYVYDHERLPPIAYHSIPHACAGGAATLDQARKSWRADMIELLGVSRHDLPPVVEHVEAIVAGMWVRTRIGAVHRDAVSDRMFLQALLSERFACEIRTHVERAAHRRMRAVVVIVEPDETMGAVLDQMRAHEVLFVVHSDAETVARWVAIYQSDEDGAGGSVRLANHIDLRTVPVKELTRIGSASGTCEVILSPTASAIATSGSR
jgi:hypothetical protein